MASYHYAVKVISRNIGTSVVAAAAYRSGERLRHDPGQIEPSAVAYAAHHSGTGVYSIAPDRVYDFTDKPHVVHAEILTPENAPAWCQDRQTLWNTVEAGERRKDAQLARDLVFALPRELEPAECIALAREHVQACFVDRGMIADFAVHDPPAADGERQTHCHVLLTMREVGPDGFGGKAREWNRRGLVVDWRKDLAERTNRALERAGRQERVTHLSFKAQNVDLEPTVKLGPASSRREGKGERSERLAHNRGVRARNAVRLEHDPTIALQALRHTHAGTPPLAAVEKFVGRYAGKARAPAIADKVMRFLGQQLERLQAAMRALIQRGRRVPVSEPAPTANEEIAMATVALRVRLNRELDDAMRAPRDAKAAVNRIRCDMDRLPLVVERVRRELAQERAAARGVAKDGQPSTATLDRMQEAARKIAREMRSRDRDYDRGR